MPRKKQSYTPKYEFGLEFQQSIINFIILGKQGYKAIDYVEDSYFDDIHQAMVVRALKTFWKSRKKIASRVMLKEQLRKLYTAREFHNLLLPQDKEEIDQLVNTLYTTPPQDEEDILDSVIKFAQYVELRTLQETQDLKDFSSYENYSVKVNKILTLGSELDEDKGIFLVRDAQKRTIDRAMGYSVNPTPFWQLNQLTSAGGLEKHSLVMVMSKAKRFKTGFLLNWAVREMARRKQGFYVDLENGQIAIATRGDQSVIKSSKKEVIDGIKDKVLLKKYRKYKRLGSELVIKRFPAYKTTTLDILRWLQKLKQEDHLDFKYGVIDYGDLGMPLSGKSEDDKRISDFYVDMKNLAEELDLEYLLTASHVNRKGEIRMATKFLSEDVAKSIDKVRHCDMILGLQENEEEKEAGVMRLEIIDQRDGVSSGNCLFWVDIEKQLATEFTREEVKEYRAQMGEDEDGEVKGATKKSDI